MNLIAYIDRNYNLFFHNKKCYKLRTTIPLRYNQIIDNPMGYKSRHMGNDWYKIQDNTK